MFNSAREHFQESEQFLSNMLVAPDKLLFESLGYEDFVKTSGWCSHQASLREFTSFEEWPQRTAGRG
jgi:hypothetical protein